MRFKSKVFVPPYVLFHWKNVALLNAVLSSQVLNLSIALGFLRIDLIYSCVNLDLRMISPYPNDGRRHLVLSSALFKDTYDPFFGKRLSLISKSFISSFPM